MSENQLYLNFDEYTRTSTEQVQDKFNTNNQNMLYPQSPHHPCQKYSHNERIVALQRNYKIK